MATKIPTLDQLQQYDVNRRGEYEGIRQTLYDSATYDASAGHTQLQFFQVPQGQGGKTIADTNMKAAGQLPQPQHFLVESIEIHYFPGVLPVIDTLTLGASEFTNDMYTLLKSGSLDFFIGSKSYLEEAPIGRFPPKTKMESHFGVHFTQASAADQQITMDYGAWVGRPYYLDPPVLLVPNQNWNVNLNWPAAVTLPSDADGKMFVVLDGILYRQSQ
ncbi:MAG: hypothetical protein ABW148_18670 [Sedimenticola sp.]